MKTMLITAETLMTTMVIIMIMIGEKAKIRVPTRIITVQK